MTMISSMIRARRKIWETWKCVARTSVVGWRKIQFMTQIKITQSWRKKKRRLVMSTAEIMLVKRNFHPYQGETREKKWEEKRMSFVSRKKILSMYTNGACLSESSVRAHFRYFYFSPSNFCSSVFVCWWVIAVCVSNFFFREKIE